MFADELASNASKKRAEANRAKRRQIKQQQQQQQQKKPSVDVSTTPSVARSDNDGAAACSTGATTTAPKQPPPSVLVTPAARMFATPPAVSSDTGQPKTALERANEQRALRATEAQQQKAAVRLQSHYRRFHSNQTITNEFKQLLKQRLEDLQTVSGIIQAKKGITYVPPPATTTSLVRMLLWLAFAVPKSPADTPKVRASLPPEMNLCLQQMMELCFLPSLLHRDDNKNDNMNPFLVWTQSKEGKHRLRKLIHLTLITLMETKAASVTDACFAVCLKFLREITATPASSRIQTASTTTTAAKQHPEYVSMTRLLLKPNSGADVLIPPSKQELDAKRGGMLAPLLDSSKIAMVDLVSLLRYYLLFVVAGPAPIPIQAEAQRQGCIPEKARARAGSLCQFAWQFEEEVPSHGKIHGLRFCTHIMTVPLLVWKLSSEALTFLMKPSSATGVPPCIALEAAFTLAKEGSVTTAVKDMLPSEDVPIDQCPATMTQCLLSNLLQIGKICASLNGSSLSSINFAWAQQHVEILALLLDAVPVRTFSARESAVEWISDGKGHLTPVVLSIVVLDQCKALFVDSYVRNLFSCAIDEKHLDMNKVLNSRNQKDEKMEKELAEEAGSSAALMAAKESQIDRNKSFWNSSKWARKVSKSVAGLLSSTTGGKDRVVHDGGALKNTSAASRMLAENGTEVTDGASAAGREDYTPNLFVSLCSLFAVVLGRWGGGGGRDEIAFKGVSQRKNSPDQETATSMPEMFTVSLLNVLCFSTKVVQAAWCLIQSYEPAISEVQSLVDPDKGSIPVRQLTYISDPAQTSNRVDRGASVLYLFTAAMAHLLIVTDDVEIHDLSKPLPLHQLRRVITMLKKLLYRVSVADEQVSKSARLHSSYAGLALITASSRTFRDLYDRSSRRPLCVPSMWLCPGLLEKEIKSCRTQADFVTLLNSTPVLRLCPMLVSFKRRLELFDKIVKTNREELQGVNSPNPFNPNPLKPARVAVINRGRILEDGLATMNHLGPNMRERISVHYVNEAGAKETGIDAGGLFKEFWTDLCAIAFDVNYALFQVTENAGNCMFPSPMSSSAHGRDHIVLFEFLGRILGKALYEGITIQPRFAHFFLSFLRGDYNFLHMIHDLSTVDPQLHSNLMFLKTYDGDAADLCLTFTVTNDDFGGQREINLIPNGSSVEVTNANKQRYIGLVAKYYVVDRIKEQSEAFCRGLWDVIDPGWLRLFNEPELQVLISGASDGKIDVEDLRRHTRYMGGFTGIDRTVSRFWNVFASLDGKQQGALLRFVTSCERPPPLGFASLNPPFTIQRVGILRDGDKLPSSSTCFNILKLPTYSSEKVLRDRLLFAINSGAGFELT